MRPPRDRVARVVVLVVAVLIAGACSSDDEESIEHTIDPIAGVSVVKPGQGIIPYDLCYFEAPVLGAVTFDDVRAAGVVGFDDEVQSPGGGLYSDEYGFLSRGVGCHWFLEEGSLSIGMQPGRSVFDGTSGEEGSAAGESSGFATVAGESEAAALVPADGYGGWATFSVTYRVDEDVQPLRDQRAVNIELLEVFLDKARLVPPPEPEIDLPEWFACQLPDSFGSPDVSVVDVGRIFGLNEPRDEMGIGYTNGVMKCTIWEGRATNGDQTIWGDWTTSVSFVFDEERSERADSFYWEHEIETELLVEIEGLTGWVERSGPESSPAVHIEVQTPDGRVRVSTTDPEIDRDELQRVGIEIMTTILANRS